MEATNYEGWTLQSSQLAVGVRMKEVVDAMDVIQYRSLEDGS